MHNALTCDIILELMRFQVPLKKYRTTLTLVVYAVIKLMLPFKLMQLVAYAVKLMIPLDI